MLDERVDERAGAHRPPDPVEPYPPPHFSQTAPPTSFARPCLVFTSAPGLSWLIPLVPGPHEPADGTEDEARFPDRSPTRSWTVDVRVSCPGDRPPASVQGPGVVMRDPETAPAAATSGTGLSGDGRTTPPPPRPACPGAAATPAMSPPAAVRSRQARSATVRGLGRAGLRTRPRRRSAPARAGGPRCRECQRRGARAYGSCVRGRRTNPWPGRADHGGAVGQLPQEM